jgi:hypothetical protein
MLLTNQAISPDSLNKFAANTITFFILKDFLPSDSSPLSSDTKIISFGSAPRVSFGFVHYPVFYQAHVGSTPCSDPLPYLSWIRSLTRFPVMIAAGYPANPIAPLDDLVGNPIIY